MNKKQAKIEIVNFALRYFEAFLFVRVKLTILNYDYPIYQFEESILFNKYI